MEKAKIGIIGCGTMGAQIAQLFAMTSFSVTLIDIENDLLKKAIKNIKISLEKLSKKGKIKAEDISQTMNNIQTNTNLSELKHCNFIIEAIVENIKIKEQTLRQIDKICPENTIFATNTSSISITKLASFTNRSEKVIGMHFMNPPIIMPLIEIIHGLNTSVETVDYTLDLCKKIQKEAVKAKEAPGFIVNRILLPMINEAIFVLQEDLASVEDIDKAMKLGTNQPMGPLALADLIGLDTCLSIMDILHDQFKDSKYRACNLLRKYVDAGYLGRKSGRGFYTYT